MKPSLEGFLFPKNLQYFIGLIYKTKPNSNKL